MIISAEEFVRLRTSQNPEEYNQAAHDSASDEIWLKVIENYPDMRKWVAHNKTISNHIIEALARDVDAHIRWFIANKRKTPPAVLEKLARDPDESVRHRVALKKRHPPISSNGCLRMNGMKSSKRQGKALCALPRNRANCYSANEGGN